MLAKIIYMIIILKRYRITIKLSSFTVENPEMGDAEGRGGFRNC